ncbi:MAG: aminoacyl--tRNA ligase-related protein [Streptosporangiaceae bacterium]
MVWDAEFERTARALTAALARLDHDLWDETAFPPPVISRAVLARGGYLASFPDLVGGVATFTGDDGDHAAILTDDELAARWEDRASASDVALAPAACYFIYPLLAGTLPSAAIERSVIAQCYRHEPSEDPMRLRSFRMYERVMVGDQEAVDEHARRWLHLGREFLASLGLTTEPAIANDPFFGRAGLFSAERQRRAELKTELRWPSEGAETTAIMSVNQHGTHFAEAFQIQCPDGRIASSACAAFGVERVTLALSRTHGLEIAGWPRDVRATLSLP